MISIAALLAFGMPQGTAPPPRPAADAVVATVDGAPILASDVEPYLWDWKSREVISEIASHRMIAAEAARKNITATDAEVKAKIDQQLASIRAQLQEGQTTDSFVKEKMGGMSRLGLIVRTSILVEKLAATELEPGKYVKVASIIFRTNGDTTDDLSRAIKKADAAYASLKGGTPWADVLRIYEKNPQTVANGGLVGWKAYDVFPESVRAQLTAIRPMGYTKPTQTQYGIQIFRLIARGDEASPAELTDLRAQYVLGSRQSVVERLRAKSKIEIK